MDMYKKMSMIKFLSFRAIVVFLLFSAIFIAISGYDSYLKFKDNSKNIKINHIDNVKEKLKWEVKHYIGLINNTRKRANKEYRNKIFNRVNEAHDLATSIYKKYKNTKSDKEIKEIIIEVLRNIRFENKNGYYFIFDLDGIERLFADRPELEGKNMLQIHNHDNIYVVQDMIKLAKKHTEGFYTYKWTKPNQGKKEFEKISYIKLFKKYGWVIGAGVYKNDIEQIAKNRIIDNVENLKFDPMGNNYIFIGDWDGVSQTYPAKGKNMLHIKDKNGLYIVKELIKKAKNGGGYVEYIMPDIDGIKSTTKLSYTEPIKGWRWYVGAGLYVDDINEEIIKLKNNMYKDMKRSILVILSIVFVLFILFMLLNKYFYNKLENDFSSIIDFLDSVVKNDKEIDRKSIVFEEFDNIAKSANNMLKKKIQLDNELAHMAHHDTLTKLPNRVLLQDRIERAKENADRYNKIFAICFVDLDNFKKINDGFGHDYGDDILFQFAQKLKQNIRKVDTVARVGGDEFILLLEQIDSVQEVKIVIEKIQNSLKIPIVSKSQEFLIGASFGISIYPTNGSDIKELITKADNTMYEAKKSGKNRYQFYKK